MDYFNLPSGYACITRQNDDTLIGHYSGYYTRDTLTLINWKWVKTSTSTSTYPSHPSNYSCLNLSRYVPNSTMNALILPAVIIVLCLFKVIMNMFMGVRR